MLGESRFLRSLRLRNFLSFGPESEALELGSLNVLIGPNASGKSNFIEAIGLLKACGRGNLADEIRAGGGIAEWLWKGAPDTASAELDVRLRHPQDEGLRHLMVLGQSGHRLQVVAETIAGELPDGSQRDEAIYYRLLDGRATIGRWHTVGAEQPLSGNTARAMREVHKSAHLVGSTVSLDSIALDQSILSQRREPEFYSEMSYLARSYESVRLYRDWNIGRNSPLRRLQRTDMSGDFLDEDASNLPHVLNNLETTSVHMEVVNHLRDVHPDFYNVSAQVLGGSLQLVLLEGRMRAMPSTRLSDGTLKYLCLLAILCHPSPPPLICIEEPELGLHPDLLHILAKLLIEASHRTQLIVTTHSDILVDALSEVPEAVVVCERHEGSTVMRRLDARALKVWLDKYSLGDLWRRGQIGGNRW